MDSRDFALCHPRPAFADGRFCALSESRFTMQLSRGASCRVLGDDVFACPVCVAKLAIYPTLSPRGAVKQICPDFPRSSRLPSHCPACVMTPVECPSFPAVGGAVRRLSASCRLIRPVKAGDFNFSVCTHGRGCPGCTWGKGGRGASADDPRKQSSLGSSTWETDGIGERSPAGPGSASRRPETAIGGSKTVSARKGPEALTHGYGFRNNGSREYSLSQT